jgi:all-trans-retinol 13,14-reductase
VTFDFVVIGAGMSGITSALILARNGCRVALVEKAERIAPVLRGFSRRGIHFDTGFHYTGGLDAGEPLDLFFRYLGLSDHVVSFPFNEDGFDVFRSLRDSFEFRFPCGYGALRDRISAAFPREAGAVEQYLRMIKHTCDAMPYLNLDADFGTITSLQSIHGPTLQQTLDSLTDNTLLKGMLSMHCLLYGVSPAEVPFTQHASIVGNYYQSARGIRGGGQSLVTACDARLAALGVDLFCGKAAAELTVTAQGEVAGVRLDDDTTLACRGCIATVHPRTLLELVPEDSPFRPAYRKRLNALEETVSAYLAFVTSDVPVPSLAGANLFAFPEVERLAEMGTRPLEETPLYLTGAYRETESAPRGYIGISPTRQPRDWERSVAGRRPDGYRRFKDEIVARLQRHIERLCPELGGAAQIIEGATPLTVRDFSHSPGGGLYGVKHMVGQYNPLPVTKIKGLLLAGQAVVSPGILGAVLSGFVACGAILGHDRLRKELKACS